MEILVQQVYALDVMLDYAKHFFTQHGMFIYCFLIKIPNII